MFTTDIGNMGWRCTLTAEGEQDSYLSSDGLEVTAKTARDGKELFLYASHDQRHTLIWLEPDSLALVALTTGDTQEAAWNAMDAIRGSA